MLLSLSCVLSLVSPAMASGELKPTRTNYRSQGGNGYMNYHSDGFEAHLVKVDDGYFRLENTKAGYDIYGNWVEGGLFLEYYNEDFQVTRVSSIPTELEEYIAFYEGEDHYYILFAQDNPNEDNSVEVIRVVQYDKDWNRLKATNIRKMNTVGYQRITTADMAEVDGKLLIHTNHTMYKTHDGINHQANLRFVIDIDSMELLQRDCGIFNNSTGYVSHSFNQLVDVAADGGVYTADHGDAVPRGMALFSWPDSSIVGRVATDEEFFLTGETLLGLPTMVLTMDIYGMGGDNTTHAQLGGLEVSSTHAIMAGISMPQDGTNQGTYNIFVTATDRNNFTDSGNKFKWVTSYSETADGLKCTNPYLIEVQRDKFLLIWTETRVNQDPALCWTYVDKAGNLMGDIYRTPGDLSEAQPVFNNDGNLVWYYSCYSIPEFCILNLSTNTLSTTMATTERGGLNGSPSPWAEQEILAAENADLITAHNRDNFQTSITRFQFAELVVNLTEMTTRNPIVIDESKQFADTTEETILKAASAGIVDGVGNNLFKPDDSITREQIATMLDRAMKYIVDNGAPDLAPKSGDLTGYTDANGVSTWAKAAVARLAANDIMKGTSSNTLSPKSTATVESCILLIYRLYSAI